MWGKVICDGAMIHSSSKTWSETRRDGLYKCITCRNSGRRADFHVQTFGFIGNSLSSALVSNHRGIRAPYLSRFLQQTSTYFVHSHKHFTLRCQWDIFFHRIAEKTKIFCVLEQNNPQHDNADGTELKESLGPDIKVSPAFFLRSVSDWNYIPAHLLALNSYPVWQSWKCSVLHQSRTIAMFKVINLFVCVHRSRSTSSPYNHTGHLVGLLLCCLLEQLEDVFTTSPWNIRA